MRRTICALGSLVLLALSSAPAEGGPFLKRIRPVVTVIARPTVISPTRPVVSAKPVVPTTGDPLRAVDALDEVNATRATRGLRPFLRDAGLTQAAKDCAAFRAANLIEFHTANDFAYVPAGTRAGASGTAAWPPEYGWGACCTYENWTYAGAAYCVGRDGKRYMHLFVRN